MQSSSLAPELLHDVDRGVRQSKAPPMPGSVLPSVDSLQATERTDGARGCGQVGGGFFGFTTRRLKHPLSRNAPDRLAAERVAKRPARFCHTSGR
jgi:hypothetical protein